MSSTTSPIPRFICAVLAGLMGFVPAWSQAVQPQGDSILIGSIRDTTGQPLAGVTVLAYHLATEVTVRSDPTDKRGAFRIENLRLGYYDVAVETPDGLFVGNAVVNVGPDGKAILEIVVAPFDLGTSTTEQTFTGTNSSGDGVARVDEQLTKKEFWQSPRGIAILATSGGALLLLFATSDDSTELPVSPFAPQ